MRWPWRRAEERAGDEAHAARGTGAAGDEPAAAHEPATQHWAELDALVPISGPIEPVVDQRFDRSLTSWHSPQTIQPVQRLVNIESAPTLVSGLSIPAPVHPVTAAPAPRPRLEGRTYFPGAAPVQRTLSFAPAQAPAAPAPPVHRVLSAAPADAGPLDPIPAEPTTSWEPATFAEPAPEPAPAPAPAPEPMPVVQAERAAPTAPPVLPPAPAGHDDAPHAPTPALVPEPFPPDPPPPAARRRGLGPPLPRSFDTPPPAAPPARPAPVTTWAPGAPAVEPAAELPTAPVEPSEPPAGEVVPLSAEPATTVAPVVAIQRTPAQPELGGWSDAPGAEWTDLPVSPGPVPLTREAPPTRTWRAGAPLTSAVAPTPPAATGGPARSAPAIQRQAVGSPVAPPAAVGGGWAPITASRFAGHDSETIPEIDWPVSRAGDIPGAPGPTVVQRTAAGVPRPTGNPPPRPADAGSAAVQAGVAQREADGSVTFFEPEAHRPAPAAPTNTAASPTPVIAREAAPGPTRHAAPGPGGHGATDLDELAQKLYGRIRTMLKRDLLLDRERSGSLVRGPR